MMTTWFFLIGSAAIAWLMPEQFAAEQRGALMIVNLQMLAFCLLTAGRGLWFLIKERKAIGAMIRDIRDAH